MQYEPGERDMVMLQHKIEIENKDGSKETRTSTLFDYGDPMGYSSMGDYLGAATSIATSGDNYFDFGVVSRPIAIKINGELIIYYTSYK